MILVVESYHWVARIESSYNSNGKKVIRDWNTESISAQFVGVYTYYRHYQRKQNNLKSAFTTLIHISKLNICLSRLFRKNNKILPT